MVATLEKVATIWRGFSKPLTVQDMDQKRKYAFDEAVYFASEGPQRAAGAVGTSTLELVHGSRPPKAPVESLMSSLTQLLLRHTA